MNKKIIRASQITERIDQLRSQMVPLNLWEDRYKFIIDLGKDLEALPEVHRLEQNKVKGCQSQVWLYAEEQNGRVKFYGDSDASIVKGLVALLLFVYDLSTPDELLTTKPTFLEELGLKQHLSMSRANGLNAMAKQIAIYGLAFKVKASQKN